MPGGSYRDLSASALREIARRWPALEADAIKFLASTFQIRAVHKAETPTEIRKKMDRVVKQAIELRLEMQTLSEEALEHLANDYRQTGDEKLFFSLTAILDRLKAAAMRSHNAEIGNDGRSRTGARHGLIMGLANQLENIGVKVDARPMGDLCRLTEIVTQDLGISTDTRSVVRDALRQRGGGDSLADG